METFLNKWIFHLLQSITYFDRKKLKIFVYLQKIDLPDVFCRNR